MNYHKQLILHDPDNGKWGDCFRTALACLLDLQPKDVPHFGHRGPDSAEFNARINAWLGDQNLTLITVGLVGGPDKVMEAMKIQNPGVVYLLSGKSPRCDESHVVIAQDDKIIHDPHPDGTGLDGPDADGAGWAEFLVVSSIHKLRDNEPDERHD